MFMSAPVPCDATVMAVVPPVRMVVAVPDVLVACVDIGDVELG